MTDRDHGELNIDLDPPAGMRLPAIAVIDGVEEAIQGQVLTLASENTDYDQDFVSWLENQGLLGAEWTDASPGESVMADRYGERTEDIDTEVRALRDQNDVVNISVDSAFTTTNETFQEVMSKVEALQDELAQAPEPVQTSDRGPAYIPIGAEYALVGSALNTLSDIIGLVDNAQARMESEAGRIDDSSPDVGKGGNYSGTSGGSPSSGVYPAVSASEAEVNAVGDNPGSIVDLAKGELAKGVGEFGENNLRYLDGSGTPDYDIGLAWCSAFATDMWKKAGYDIDWSNKNLVSAVWNDAQSLGLNRPGGQRPEPGDLIVFRRKGAPNHIGIVETVEETADGEDYKVHTIEGNSSDRLNGDNEYDSADPTIIGYVKPPEPVAV